MSAESRSALDSPSSQQSDCEAVIVLGLGVVLWTYRRVGLIDQSTGGSQEPIAPLHNRFAFRYTSDTKLMTKIMPLYFPDIHFVNLQSDFFPL